MTTAESLVIIDNNREQLLKYTCPLCNDLLRDAVQTSCGHWLCHGCAEDLFKKSPKPLCPRRDCGEELTSDDGKPFFPDKFVRKEMGKFSVKCRNHNRGCSWQATYSELLKHIGECLYEVKECEYCNELIPLAEYDDHIYDCPKAATVCPFKVIGCKSNEEFTRRDMEKHVLRDGLLQHMLLIGDYMKSHSIDQVAGLVGNAKTKAVAQKKNDNVAFDGPSGASETRSFPLRKNDHVEVDGGPGMHHDIGLQSMQQTLVPHNVASKYEVDQLRTLLAQKESLIQNLQEKITCLEATFQAKATENEDRDFRLSLMENSNYDGTMLWKIPQFSQRMDDARTGKYTSIFSLPFNSGRYGYKMCLRLYILGDGIGKGTHMSLFFVVMKGEFDNILQWPFTHKVTFKLINQCGGRDVVDIFQPDPLSSSFQKPKTEMNVASGCPRFISLSELMQGGFIVDDTVFIKVKVDTSNIRHP